VSLIERDTTVLDYWLHVNHMAEFLLHGEKAVTGLAMQPPYPLWSELVARSGVIVDRPARRLLYWTAEPVPARLAAMAGAAWPGWNVERHPFGYAGHLAATGCRDPDLLMTEDQLRQESGDFEPRLDADWIAQRRTLPVDPRSLRRPTVQVLHDD
jgi:hypothetical protein